MIQVPEAFWAELYALAAPIYFALALTIPIAIVFIISRCLAIYRIADAKIKRRIFWTAIMLVAAHLFLISDALAAILGLEYVEYVHVRRGAGIVTIVGIHFTLTALITEALYFSVRKKERTELFTAKKLVQYATGTLIAILIVSLILTEEPFWKALTFAVMIALLLLLYVSLSVVKKLSTILIDPASSNFLKYLNFILLMLFYPIINTVLILFELPPSLNVLGIPVMVIIVYSAFKATEYLIKTY